MVRFFFSFVVALLLFQGLSIPVDAVVTCPSSDFDGSSGVCIPTASSTGLSDKDVSELLTTFMNWLLGIFGFIAIIAFVISGLQYLTAAGDEKQAETAKRNLQYSIIGIIVAFSGFVVLTAVNAFFQGSSTF